MPEKKHEDGKNYGRLCCGDRHDEENENHAVYGMEHVAGGSLSQLLRSASSLRSVLEVFLGICAGLEHIHNRGLVHRDLKPANILMTSEGVPKITDLGLARRIESNGQRSQLTQNGAIVGTTAYMAPEQLLSSSVGPPADLYALGVCLYEAATGRHPFKAESQPAMLRAQLQEIPVSPLQFRPELPPRLATTILSLLEKDPDKRPRSAAVVATALQRCIEDLSIRADVSMQTTLQGRGQDLEALAARCVAGAGLLMVAPSEVGRSRLLEELASHLGTRGVSVYLIAPGVELSSIFGALGAPPDEVVRLFFAGGAALVAGGLRRRLQEAAVASNSSKPSSQSVLESGVRPGSKSLERASRDSVILVCDDLERLDPFTQAVLEKLIYLTPPERSGWLLSVTQAQAFALPDQAKRYELAPLKDADIQALAEFELKGQLSPALAAWMVPRAGGSPRQLKLMAAALRADNALERSDGTVGLAQGASPPANVLESILNEVERQDEDTRTMLRSAALLREPFVFTAASAASGLSEDRADKAVENLIRMGLFEETGEHFRIGSSQLRQRLAGELTERVRRRFHARIAEVVKDTAERGRHLALAGHVEEAAVLLSEAAQSSHDRGLYGEACSLWDASANCVDSMNTTVAKARSLAADGRVREALDCLGKLPQSSADGSVEEVLVCQAELLILSGAFEDAYSLCKSIADPRGKALLASVFEHQGNFDAACQSLIKAIEDQPPDACALRERLARLQLRQGKTAEALKCATLNVERARTTAEKLQCLTLLAEIQRNPRCLAEALELASTAGWMDESARIEMLRADMSENEGDANAAMAARKRAIELLRPFGESPALVDALTRLGQTLQAMGQASAAEGALREAVKVSDATADKGARSLARRGLGTFFLESRNLEAAAQSLQDAVDLAETISSPAEGLAAGAQPGLLLAEALAELAVCHRLLGRPDSSLLAAEKSVAAARSLTDPAILGKALVTLGEACTAKKKWKNGLESLQKAQNLIPSNSKLYPRLLEALAQLHTQGSQQEFPGLSTAQGERYRQIARSLRERVKGGVSNPSSWDSRLESLTSRLPRKLNLRRVGVAAGLVACALVAVAASRLMPKTAHVRIESEPAGAAVVANQAHGVTPCTLDLPAGAYALKVELKGYQDYADNLTVEAGQSCRVVAQLVAASGSLSLSSVPGDAVVYLDGKMSGKTPCHIPDLAPGSHVAVRLSKPGYLDTTGSVAVVAGSDSQLSLSLKKIAPQPKAPAPAVTPHEAVPPPEAQRPAVTHSAPVAHYRPAPHHVASAPHHTARLRHLSALDAIIHRMAQGK